MDESKLLQQSRLVVVFPFFSYFPLDDIDDIDSANAD